MRPERWRKIEELYHSALERESSQRVAFLKEACAGDEDLFREVRSLLEHEAKVETFMESPALELAGKALASEQAESPEAGQGNDLIGQLISHYRVLERLGGGGMGVVYKAQDTRLRRPVALKFLPRELEKDHQAFERLRREAQAASGLNHPNICTIYDIEEAAGQPFIAMELLEGETLRERINAGTTREPPLRVDMLIDLAIQVSDALDAAHTQDVIHRDIKPENIFITQRGQAKVLDFGIAKQLPPRRATQPRQGSMEGETWQAEPSLTMAGAILGTVSYMSPEQARGEKLDARTDLFSFGAVLFEAATGQPAFPGKTSAMVFDAILHREPVAVSVLNPQIPQKLEEIIHKALEKDPKLRYQTASDLRTDLLRLKRDTESGRQGSRAAIPSAADDALREGASSARSQTAFPELRQTTDAALIAGLLKKHPRAFSLAAAMTVLVIAAGGYTTYRLASRRPPSRGPAMKISQLTYGADARAPVISGDGKYVVYVQEKEHQAGLWLYQVATGSNVQIVARVALGSPPTFSNDGNYIYYVNYDKGYKQSVLYKVASLGGEPRKLFENVSSAVTLSPDGKQVAFVRRSEQEDQLTIANEDGSAAKALYAVRWPVKLFNNPTWSPDGKTIVVPRQTPSPLERRLVAVSVASGEAEPLGSHVWLTIFRSAWLPDNTGLIAVASDVNSQDKSQIYEISYPAGEVRRITFDLYAYNGLGLTADGNSLVTVKNESHSSLWVGSMGKGQAVSESVRAEIGGEAGLDWTPEGRIVLTADRGAEENLAIVEANGSGRKPLTDLGVPGEYIFEPSVCGDGRHIVAVSNHGGSPGLFKMDADGTNLVRLTSGTFDTSPSCSRDGKWVIFESNRTGKPALWKVAVEGGEQKQLRTEECISPAVSPDEAWVACLDGPEKVVISPTGGGNRARTLELKGPHSMLGWTSDGQGLTYAVNDGVSVNLWNQAVGGGPPARITNFDTGGIFGYAWSRDGKRLAVVRGSLSQDVVLITNFRGKE